MQLLRSAARLFAMLLLALALLAQEIEVIDGHLAVANEVIVKYRTGSHARLHTALVREHRIGQSRQITGSGLVHMRSDSESAAELVRSLSREPDVLYAEPNYIYTANNATPNDPRFGELWGLKNTGQNGGTPNADIAAVQAWATTTGSRNVAVGVIDTGIEYTHPDLAANIWSAPSSFTVTFGPGDSITCPAGSHGYDAIANTCDPMDQNGHGTHVSGTIGGVGNNAAGVAGVNWASTIVGLRFLDANGSGSTTGAIRAINFAIQLSQAFPNGPKLRVLSNSWGGSGFSQALLDAINAANSAGLLFVVAAGNSGANLDTQPSYPAAYSAPNLISVAATDSADHLASFSNYSATAAHLGAPGVGIVSTYKGGGYATLNGTSMATPHVSGAAALVLSACGSLTTAALRQNLLTNTDPVAALAGKTSSGGRLNVYRAVTACGGAPVTPGFTLGASPNAVTVIAGSTVSTSISVTAVGGFSGSVTLSSSGLPAGVTAAFAPAVIAPGATSRLTLTASSSAAAATGSVTVRGASGTLSAGATVGVTVQVPGFALAANPASLAFKPGESGTSVITVTPTGGFKGSVTPTATGLPTGVTAGYATSTSGFSVKLTAATTAAPGSYTVTIRGASGTVTSTVPIALTLNPLPGFTIAAAPAALAISRSGTVTSIVTLTAVGGFAANVALSVTGMPSGITATLNPSTVKPGTPSTLTVTASSTAAAGTATLTVKASSGALNPAAAVTLTVRDPPGFNLTATPPTQTVSAGGTARFTLTLTPTGGFTGPVSVQITGLPLNSTPSISNSGALSIVTTPKTPIGPNTITITGTGTGVDKKTVTVSLNVTR